ncbi:MAG: E3 binding domain-containing protein [Rubrobacter sp.]|nr:E3 binding domain-containing protein [Rubrobacter sp.]
MAHREGSKHDGRGKRGGKAGSGEGLSLDARQLKIEEVNLEISGLLDIEIKNLEAELTLDLDLDKLTVVLGRILEAVDENPESLRSVLETVESGVKNAAKDGEAEGEATEAAERKAKELGVSLASVEGTGSGGRITVEDVEKAAGNGE